MSIMKEEYIIDKQGKKRKATRVLCEQCGKSFLKPTRFLKSRQRHFCSLECFHKSTNKQIELVCDFCKKTFYVKQSNVLKSRSGLHFCSRHCKDEAQKIKNGFVKMHPSHYGKTKFTDYTPQHVYQRLCFDVHPHKCCVCGEEKIVAVHHYDGNHNNNDVCNLVPLCPTHHCYIHSKYKDEIINIIDKYIEQFKK